MRTLSKAAGPEPGRYRYRADVIEAI